MRKFKESNIRELVFVLTERCNLACIYCYETHKGNNVLSSDCIKEKIVEAMLKDDGYEILSVVFFGGEPLMEFDTIREVVEWFHEMKWPIPSKKCYFQVSTNGTLLNFNMKHWFSTYRDEITLSLSMDGTKSAHDRNRSNSYDKVIQHIEFFRDNWPNQPVKMTVSAESLSELYDGVVHIHSLGLSVEPDIVFENIWGDYTTKREAVCEWINQLDLLVNFYSENPQLRRPRLLKRNLLELFNDDPESYTFCGAGKHTMTITANGNEYPCFRFAPVAVNLPLSDLSALEGVENALCSTCPFEHICQSCEGHNYLESGFPFYRTTYHCEFFKISLLASAKLMLFDHPEDLLEAPEHQSVEQMLRRTARLLAIRMVDEFCTPVVDWATKDCDFPQ